MSIAVSSSLILSSSSSHAGDWRSSTRHNPRRDREPKFPAPERPHRCSLRTSRAVVTHPPCLNLFYWRQNRCTCHYSPTFAHFDLPRKRGPKVVRVGSWLTSYSASGLAHQDVDHEAPVVAVLTRLEAGPEAATITAEATVVPARR